MIYQKLSTVLALFSSFSLFATPGIFNNGTLESRDHLNPKRSLEDSTPVHGRAFYIESPHFGYAWGHAVQDTFVPIYVCLKERDLLEHPVTVCIFTNDWDHSSSHCQRISSFFQRLFPHAKLLPLTHRSPSYSFEEIEPFRYGIPLPSWPNQREMLRSFGFQRNVIIPQGIPENTPTNEFVDYALEKLGLDSIAMVPNRVYLINKGPNRNRRLINRSAVAKVFSDQGFEVIDVDLETLSPEEQIKLIRSCEYYISTHGAALTNTMFLHNDSKVMIIWPLHAKYFHSRKYCPFTSVLLSRGVKLMEYDKPYHPYDVYVNLNKVEAPDYFVRYRQRLLWIPKKKGWESIDAFPLPCMYDIYLVDLYIENPREILELILKDLL
ncbi:MAG: glycosyltransferase family 61 protein [Chlamydiales bacterium]|nr:glycosyltransferase family 61 protein [Chlamydiales bacterium]